MEHDEIIRKLRRGILVHRIFIAGVALALFCVWAYGHFRDTRSLIIVDGKPVVCVGSEQVAKDVLDRVKNGAGSEVEFKQDVCVARAPRGASPVSRHMALRVIERSVTLVAPRWAIIVDGKPVVALPDRKTAGEVLELAKLKFGKMVPNLAEEPQFKEKVTVDVAAVDPTIYRGTDQSAMDFLFRPALALDKDAVYSVRKGDVGGSIAHRFGMKLAALKAMNPEVNLDRLQIDDNIRIKASEPGKPRITVIVRDQSQHIESISAPVHEISSAQLMEGKQRVVSAGRDGSRKVTVAAIYENGRKTGSEVLSEEVIREPLPRDIAVGIKTCSVGL